MREVWNDSYRVDRLNLIDIENSDDNENDDWFADAYRLLHQFSIEELSDCLRQTRPKMISTGYLFEMPDSKGKPELYTIE
jgi:hypothetical protein